MPAFDDAERDAFYETLYERTTAPFVAPGLTAAEVDCFRRLADPRPDARVLDLGCGWGRHLDALRAAGYDVIGLERSKVLSAKARAHGPVVRGDFRALPFGDGSFDAAACFYSSLFFFDEAGNVAALSEVARVLKPGGAFVLQTTNPMHLRRLGPGTEDRVLSDGSVLHEESEFDREAGRDVGVRKLTLPDGSVLEGRYSVRHYAPGELEVLGRRAGLLLDRVCGDMALSAFARHSRDLIVLLRKPL